MRIFHLTLTTQKGILGSIVPLKLDKYVVKRDIKLVISSKLHCNPSVALRKALSEQLQQFCKMSFDSLSVTTNTSSVEKYGLDTTMPKAGKVGKSFIILSSSRDTSKNELVL